MRNPSVRTPRKIFPGRRVQLRSTYPPLSSSPSSPDLNPRSAVNPDSPYVYRRRTRGAQGRPAFNPRLPAYARRAPRLCGRRATQRRAQSHRDPRHAAQPRDGRRARRECDPVDEGHPHVGASKLIFFMNGPFIDYLQPDFVPSKASPEAKATFMKAVAGYVFSAG